MKCLGNAMFLSINNIATFNQNNIKRNRHVKSINVPINILMEIYIAKCKMREINIRTAGKPFGYTCQLGSSMIMYQC